LTFDDETRHYTNLTEDFTLFTDKIIYICGRNFIGYVQDVSEEDEYEEKKTRFFILIFK
jgi:hypothetical protein